MRASLAETLAASRGAAGVALVAIAVAVLVAWPWALAVVGGALIVDVVAERLGA